MTQPLGRLLRAHRKRLRFALAAVATQTGLSLSYVSDIEHGRSGGSLRALGQLAAAYGVTLGEVFSEATQDYIQAGDRVLWVRDNAWRSGEVIAARDWRDGIYVDRVEAAQDDVQDALAVHPSPFRLIAEDYDEAIGLAGSMDTGMVEA